MGFWLAGWSYLTLLSTRFGRRRRAARPLRTGTEGVS